MKIAFIICTNDDFYFNECTWYLNRLIIPQGVEIEIIPVVGAKSMASGYNKAMKESDAEIKVYLHQDTFIVERYFIEKVMNIFDSNSQIGMIGVYGGVNLPKDAICYNCWNRGGVCVNNGQGTFWVNNVASPAPWEEVEAIDGLIMITGHDIEWRDDLDLAWDFYDVSQSMEFRRAGYKVVVPTEQTWCIHDCIQSKLTGYDRARKTILNEYVDFFDEPFEDKGFNELYKMNSQIAQMEKDYLAAGELDKVMEISRMIYQKNDKIVVRNKECLLINAFLHILKREVNAGETCYSFIGSELDFDQMAKKYTAIKFEIWRLCTEKKQPEYEYFHDKYCISENAYKFMMDSSVIKKEEQ